MANENIIAKDKGFNLAWLFKSSDVALAISVIGVLLMMIFPMPAILLDMLLAFSVALSLIILLVSLYVTRPLEFGVFPTVLLLATLFRLALNVATTRTILLHGANGSEGMSQLIRAFGDVVVGGDFIVGIVIFVILMIINFMVITKGAGRVAEVAARFTLDAMPGKQMAIDAELNSGHISPEEARTRRKKVEEEADFYGAMDGASKFVRGDAIAAILIAAVNMIIGFIIGVAQHNLSALDSAKTFTLLAVGDGLISAIPALMVSTAAGIVVTRATSEGNLSQEVLQQFKVHPKALYIASAMIFIFGLLPGFPTISFFILGGILLFLGRVADQRITQEQSENAKRKEFDQKKTDGDPDNLEAAMRVDILAVEVGHALIPLIDPTQDGEVVDRIKSIRKQIAQELGIIVPQIQLRDNLQLDPGAYNVLLKGTKIGSGNLMIDYWLAMDPGTVHEPIRGEDTMDPVYGLPALWVHKRDKDEASFRGYTVVNCSTVLATHITKVLREHAAELLTRQDVQYLLEKLKETNPKVVEEVIHSDRLSLGDVVKVMQKLLSEDVSVRDILSLFECLADHCKFNKNPEVLAEYCRKQLGRQIITKYTNTQGHLAVITFDRLIEDILLGGLVNLENGSSYLNLDAKTAQDVIQKVMEGVQKFETEGTQPILLIAAKLRNAFKTLINRYLNQLIIISYDEVPTEVQIKNLSMIM